MDLGIERKEVALMVAESKQTRDADGRNAWTVPNGMCTASFRRAVDMWFDLLEETL